MHISDLLGTRQTFSCEIFPPKGDMSVETAAEVARRIDAYRPDWISVTFSAGGSGNSGNTAAISALIERECHACALAHLTCLGSSEQDVNDYMRRLRESGVSNVLALRGDRAPGREVVDFEHASDLVAYLKERDPGLCVGGACYPEGHVECEDLSLDIRNLKRKVDAGVDFLVTQLFFDNDDFYRFRDRCARAHIKVPIVAGIMPFTSTKQIQRMAFNCGASIPARVIKRLAAAGDSPEAQKRAGIEYACEQLADLAQNGVDGLHIYSMNKPEVAEAAHDCLVDCGYLAS